MAQHQWQLATLDEEQLSNEGDDDFSTSRYQIRERLSPRERSILWAGFDSGQYRITGATIHLCAARSWKRSVDEPELTNQQRDEAYMRDWHYALDRLALS